MMRFRILCFSLLLAVFLNSHAKTPMEGEDALVPLDFDEAAQLLETSSREVYRLWMEQVSAFQREHDIAPSELMTELQHNSELHARFMELDSLWNEMARTTALAARSMLDPIHQDRLVAYLGSADTLSLLSFISHAGGMRMVGNGRDGWELSRDTVANLVHNSRPLQDRLVRLMFNDRSVLTLALTEGERRRIDGLSDDPDSWGFRVGQQAIFHAIQLLPEATVTRALAQATRPAQVDRLPKYLEELIEGGMLPAFGKLPYNWLVEQVEAGSLIWLNSLASTEEGFDHPLLFEHFDQLDRSQQLKMIAIRPQPEFLPVLRDAWQEAMDAAWCEGCAEPVAKSQVETLLEVLISWQTDESAGMLSALMAMDSYADIVEPWRFTIGTTAMYSESEAFVRLGMAIAREDDKLPINTVALRRLHQFDAGALAEILTTRFDRWSDPANSTSPAFPIDGSQCQRAALGLYAEGQGIPVDWRQWLPVERDASSGVNDAGCIMSMTMAALVDPGSTDPLLSWLAEMEANGASDVRYGQLTTMFRQTDPTPEQREVVAAALIDQPAWESLPDGIQDWLLGIEVPVKSQLSCDSDRDLAEPTGD